MFDFCKLDVYQKAKPFCILIKKLLSSRKHDRTTNDQWSFLAELHQEAKIRMDKLTPVHKPR